MATSSSNEDLSTSYFDHFVCNICLEVLREPVQCARNEHYFCKSCITQHLTRSQTCPVCQDHLTTTTLRPTSRVVANLLQQFQSPRCRYANRGCTASVRHEVLLSHHEECGFAPVQCSHDGCEETVNRQDVTSHEESCRFRPVTCEECKERMSRREFVRHPCVFLKEIDKNKLGLVEVHKILREIQEEQRRQGKQIRRMLAMETAKPCSTGGQHGKEITRQPEGTSSLKATAGHRKVKSTRGEEVNVRKGIKPNATRRQQDDDITRPGRMKTIPRQLKESTVSKPTKIFVAGGGNKSYEVFNWSSQQWTLYENALFFDHRNGFSFVFDNKIMICGGTDTNKVECLDMTNPRTSSVLPMSLPSTNCGKGVHYGDKILTFGGWVTEIRLIPPYRSDYDVYRSLGFSSHGVAYVNENAVAIVGGYKTHSFKNSNELTDAVRLYNPNTKHLQTLAPLPYKVSNMAVLAYYDNIIILGGKLSHGCAVADVLMYNITSQQCSKLPNMLKERANCAAVITGDTIIAIGGSTGGVLSFCHKTAEYLVLGENAWKELPKMHFSRDGATACVPP